MRRAFSALITGATLLGGCAYYNTLYNAERAFADAQRAELRGDRGAATAAYATTIEKARRSLKRDSTGRWSDDARYLIGRAHFGRGDYRAARDELQRVIRDSPDAELRTAALAYAGAAELQLGDAGSAARLLSQAIDAGLDEQTHAFARLWRGRAYLRLDRGEEGLADLDVAAQGDASIALPARGERVSWAIRRGDLERAGRAFVDLLAAQNLGTWRDSLRVFAAEATTRFGPVDAERFVATAAVGAARDVRGELTLLQAELRALAGDTAGAATLAIDVGERSTDTLALRARIAGARWLLAGVDRIEALSEPRNVLLPALALPEAQSLVRSIRMLAVLVARAEREPLALFAAGEIARDELAAPRLARALFFQYAQAASGTLWSGKALLAVRALGPAPEQAPELERLLATSVDNLYLAAARGPVSSDRYQNAEERLQRSLTVLRAEAANEAELQDAALRTTLAQLDSLRAAARRDSVQVACGQVLDSLGIAGVSADSVRAACLRGNRARMDSLIAADTTGRQNRRGGGRDTVQAVLLELFPRRP